MMSGDELYDDEVTSGRVERDWLYPNGDRPSCRNGDGFPVYMAGLCSSCWANTPEPAAPADKRGLAIRLNAKGMRLGDIAEVVGATLEDVREWCVTTPLRERRPETGTEV